MKHSKANTKKDCVILKSVSVNGNICGEFAEFKISQIYENKGSNNIEAVYTFPIPETGVISGFEAVLGGRTIKGIIGDKEDVERIQKNAEQIEDGNLLFGEINTNTLKIIIKEIIPNETVKIKISYIEELIYEKEDLKLTIPNIIEPLYLTNNDEDGIKNEIMLNRNNPYKCSLNLLVEPLTEIKFESPSHNIKIEEGDDNLYKINFKGKGQNLDKDLIIYMKEQEKIETTGMIYENLNDEKGILYLRFIPELEDEREIKNGEYIFLIDISNSMEGLKINEAKNALKLCLSNLSESDKFNIVAFGDELHYFSEGDKLIFNEQNYKDAVLWVENLKLENDAAIFEAIKYSLSGKNSETENTILLLTDDNVENEKEILNYVEENINESRIFPFGIDTSVNSYFINKLAEKTYGIAEFIYEGEPMDELVLKQFKRIRSPQVTDMEIDWGTMKIESTYPRTIEYMYHGEPFSIFARVNGEVQGLVTLKGKIGDKRIQRRIVLNSLDLEENANLIEKVWYKKRIETLEHRVKGQRGEVQEAMYDKIIEISKKVGIISNETSFMLLEQIEDPVLGIEIRKILPFKSC